MFETVIKQNLIDNRDIELLCSSFSDLAFTLNPSAYEVSDTVLRSYSVDHRYKFDHLVINIDKQLISSIEHIYKCKVKSFTGRSIVKYVENQHIDLHKDWEPTDRWVVENNKDTVHVSSVFYFNDDYDGGELIFYDETNADTKNMIIKPKAGSAVIFDALQVHSTNPIVSGIKYSYTNFYTLEG
jgi:hypothetical protein